MKETLELLERVAPFAGYLSSIIGLLIICVKPLRDRVFGFCDIMKGVECLLRADMLETYYKNHEKNEIRQHERENFVSVYKAYKALGGNSFIDDIYAEVKKWEVIT